MALDKLTKVQSVGISSFIQVVGVVTATQGFDGNITGIITATGDFSIADKIVHTGDTNTAIRFPAADTITAETGGSERFRIDSSGNLNLVSSSSSLTDLNFTDNSLNVYARVEGGKSGSGVGDLRFHTYSGGLSEAARIDSSGRLLIGGSNTYHANADDFVVQGTGQVGVTIASNSTGKSNLFFADSTSNPGTYACYFEYDHSADALKIGQGNNERIRITSAGVLQAAAGVNLQMASNGRIFVGNGGNATDPMFANVSDTNTGIAFPAADTMMFTTGGSERVRIDSAGRLLLAAQTGTARLHIKGNGGDGIKIENSGGTNGATIDLKNTLTNYVKEYRIAVAGSDGAYGTAKALFVRDQTAGVNRFEIQDGGDVKVSTGNLIIGTSGKGIDFSVTSNSSGSMTSELLDDYEEGTWTPSIQNASFTTAEGRYTKIGRQVLLQFIVGNLNTSLSAADRAIEGIPYQAANVNQVGVGFIGDVSGVTYSSGYGNIYVRINANGNSLQILQKTNDGSTHTTSPALGTGLVLRGYAWYTV